MVTDARHRLATVKKLPYDAEIEYLESTGTQWIDTGLNTHGPMSIQFSFIAIPSSSEKDIIGTRSSMTTTPEGSHIIGFYNNFLFAYNKPNQRLDTNSFSQTEQLFNITYTTTLSTRIFNVNNVEYIDNETPVYTEDFNIFIFCGGKRTDGTVQNPSQIKLLSSKVYYNDLLVQDLLPVRFTNELGQSEGAMYDKVSGQLFRNQGSGEFVMGDDVAPAPYVVTYRKPFVSFTPPPSARDYISDGLIALWDGIENAGWGTHDDSATTWVDLISHDNWENISFSENAAILNVANSKTTIQSRTTEMVCNLSPWSNNSDNALWTSYFSNNPSFSGVIPYAGIRVGSPQKNNGIYIGTSSANFVLANKFYVAQWHEKFSVAMAMQASGSTLYTNGKFSITASATLEENHDSKLNGIGTVDGRGCEGFCYCIRLYDRALTADEIAHNYAIDKIRFSLP